MAFHLFGYQFKLAASKTDRQQLDSISKFLFTRIGTMSAQLDALTAQLEANGNLISSAITLINDLAAQLVQTKAQLETLGADSNKLNELAASLAEKDQLLSSALAAAGVAPAPAPAAAPAVDTPPPVDGAPAPVDGLPPPAEEVPPAP